MSSRAEEVIRRCRILAGCTEEPGFITRTFLSPPMRQVHQYVGEWMREAGLKVTIDAAGNIRGRRGSGHTRMMIGSHLDSVPDAGAFDGILGVVMGIELARDDYNIEVIGFSEEEGIRFGVPFIGSRALTGTLERDHRIEAAIREYGLDPAQLPEAVLDPATAAYFEIHIEQGPVLEKQDRAIGVVDAIVGQGRWTLTFTGFANHAGTTPMNMRRDALAASAEFILKVEHEARSVQGLVATVGRCNVAPGAGNVVPGAVELSLDVRHKDDGLRMAAVSRLIQEAQDLGTRRGIEVGAKQNLNQSTVPMSTELTALLAGEDEYRISSGAGHDAMIIAPVLPSAMLFVRSPGGISHHPRESVHGEDVAVALERSREFLERWSGANA